MYKTFLSVMFGICMGLVISQVNPEKVLTTWELFGVMMLFVVICLWWWYAVFLAARCPAEKPLYYFLDFLTLAFVACAAKLWDKPAPWLVISLWAMFFILVRLSLVAWYEQLVRLLPPQLGALLQAPRFYRKYRSPKRVLRSDRYIIGTACMILFVAGAIVSIFLAGGIGERLKRDGDTSALRAFWTSTQPVLTEDVAKSAQPLFACIVMLGIAFTLYVVICLPEASGERRGAESSSGAPQPTPYSSGPIPDDRLAVDYSSCGEESKQRLEAVKRGLNHFQSAFSQAFPMGRRHHWSTVHSANDVEVQAFAMGLRFEVEEEQKIVNSSYLTFFIHWLDDCFDSGHHTPGVRRWLLHWYRKGSSRNVDIATLLGTQWDTIFPRSEDAGLIKFIQAAEQHVQEGENRSVFERGLRRLAIGSILLNPGSDDNQRFLNWLLEVHRLGFFTSPRLEAEAAGDASRSLLNTIKALNARTIALTSKPVQECWDAVSPDSWLTTAVMNILLINPVFYHNSALEMKHEGLSPSWAEYMEGVTYSGDLTQLAGSLWRHGNKGLCPARARQIEFILKATSKYLGDAKDVFLRRAISKG
jgi:hypothetical protein